MYAYVNGGVVTALSELPSRIRLDDGTTRTSLHEMDAATLAEYGYYAYDDAPPEYDVATQKLVGPTLSFDGEAVTASYEVVDKTSEELTAELDAAKARKIAEVQAASDAAFAAMQSGYTVGEVQSFEQQRRGAADLLAGDTETEDAQYVEALAAARVAAGDETMTALALASRIAANAAAAAQATVVILGLQQGLEVRARAATTPEELEGITWSM